MNNQDPCEPEEKRICADCTAEEYLCEQIHNSGTVALCSYCDSTETPTWALGELANRVHNVVQEHYQRTPDEPSDFELAMSRAGLDNDCWFREGETITDTIEYLAKVSNEIAEDIRELLDSWNLETDDSCHFEDEAPYDSEAHYEEKGIDTQEWEDKWRRFELALKEVSRFFNHWALAILNQVFADIHSLPVNNGQAIIESAGPGTRHTHLYRARAFQSKEDLHRAIERPDLLLGPPPPKLATAGRMNARGISVFYGASNPAIALAEVRPPVGSNVAMTRFEIIEPIKLLNLINLESLGRIAGSLFDPDHGSELERASFLRTLGDRLARPVMPSDQDIDYIATQAVADYLAGIANPTVDGIIFKSVQGAGDGYNIVLFNRAARVKELELPQGSKLDSYVSSSDGEGIDDHYTVVEWVPKNAENETQSDVNYFPIIFEGEEPPKNLDNRKITLEVDPNSIEIHSVKAAKFETDKLPVERSSISNSDLGDF